MDRATIVSMLRTSSLIVDMSIKAKSLPDDFPVDAEVVKALSLAQRSAKDALYDRSLAFGDKRLIIMAGWDDMVNALGTHVVAFQRQVKSLSSEHQELVRDKFGITVAYEPVPDPAGWPMMDATMMERFTKNLQTRLCDWFEDGQDDAIRRLNSALGQYSQRVGAYHDNMAKPEAERTRVVFRDVTVQSVALMAKLVEQSNVTGLQRVAEFLAPLAPVTPVQPDQLRKEAECRASCLAQVREALGLTKTYLRG